MIRGRHGHFHRPIRWYIPVSSFSDRTKYRFKLLLLRNWCKVVNNTWNSKNLINSYNELFELRGAVDLEESMTFATLLNMSKGDTVDIQNHSTGYWVLTM